MKRKRRKVKTISRAQRARVAFEKAARKQFALTASQAKELRKRFEDRTGTASAAELRRHPRIAAKIVPAAKAAVTRRKRRAKPKPKAMPPVVIEPESEEEEEVEETQEIFEEEATLEIEGGEDEY